MENMEMYCRCHGTSGSCTLRTCYRRTPSMRKMSNLLKSRYKMAIAVAKDNSMSRQWNPKKPDPNQLSLNLLDNTRRGRRSYRFPRSASGIRHLPRKRIRRLYPNDGAKETQKPPVEKKVKQKHRVRLVKTDRNGIPHPGGPRPHASELVYYEKNDENLFCEPSPEFDIIGTKYRECNSTATGPHNCGNLCCGRGHNRLHFYEMEKCKCRFVWCCRVECQQCLVMKTQETCL